MPPLTPRRVAWVSAGVACAVYLIALRNGWALDDYHLVVRNPAAHSVWAALGALFSPYWPLQGEQSAGLYRPLATLTYAVDWAISGGRPWWFHLTNLLLHGLVTALLAVVALRWLPPLGALAAGVVFAIHPVHVEAVANVIGRTEMLAALGLLAAVLAARRYRAADPPGRPRWLVLTLLATGLALAAKEHAVVTIVVLGLDHWLDAPATRRPAGDLYLAVATLTLAWLFLWQAIAGPLAAGSAIVPLQNLPAGQRLATVIPAQLDVVRLLAWPFDLSADYSPQVVPIRLAWSLVASLALVTSSAMLGLGLAARRRAPALTFGILAGAATYLPSSNLLFTSGVTLAERNLYVAAIAPALAVGCVVAWATMRHRLRIAVTAVALGCAAFAVRAVTRVPFWRDSRTVVIESIVQHPEDFLAHAWLGDVLLLTGDSTRALAQHLVAMELYDGYTFLAVRVGRLALARRRPALTLELGRRARSRAPLHPGPAELLVDVFLTLDQQDSARAVARAAVGANPGNLRALENYRRVLERTQAPAWRRQLAAARLDQALGHLVAATARLDSASRALLSEPGSPAGCWDLEQSLPVMRTLKPTLAVTVQARLQTQCRESER